MTKDELQMSLLGPETDLIKALPRKQKQEPRVNVESKLIPWVLSKPAAFPELRKEPFFFVNMLPVRYK
jgi:hypothetical protein